MDRVLTQDVQLSALMDGELDDASLAEALSFAADKGQATWELYHLVGDVLRSPELAAHATSPLLGRLREQIAQEPRFPVQKPEEAVVVARSAVVNTERPAANSSVFRWKMVAGFASLAAVAAIGWNSPSTLQLQGNQPPAPPVPQPTEVLPVFEGAGQPAIVRDPRTDVFLLAP